MKRDREKLLEELWKGDAEARRTSVLKAGSQVLRRRRWVRRGQQCCASLLVLVAASFAVKQFSRTPEMPAVSEAPKAPIAAPAHSLTDEELLALFPDTPVGLATLSDGKKRLLFLRPEDEERFVGRL